MKTYKDFNKVYIGCSDIATLIMVGISNNEIHSIPLHFSEDNVYNAYLVERTENESVEIGSHYKKIATFNEWLKIYDDEECTLKQYAKEINVYRAAMMGCIIEVVK